MSVSSALDEDKIGIEMSDIDLNDDSDPTFKKQHCNGHNNKKDYDQDTVYSIPVVQGIWYSDAQLYLDFKVTTYLSSKWLLIDHYEF